MAKNKSIRQGAGDLRNPAVRTGYQVKAQPVDTFVRTNAGQREKMIADALGQVSGAVSNLGAANAKKAAEEEREREKLERKATALQKDQARVEASRQAALFEGAQASQNYDENSSFDNIFTSWASSEEGAGYNTAFEGYKDNPEAQAVFANTFRLQTEANLIKGINESILTQKKDVISNMLPTIWKEAQDNNPKDPTAAFRATESQLFTRLTAKPEDGGYGLKNEIAAGMLGDIFNTYALSRDENGRANTYLAEQYILSGKGGDDMREKLTTTIIKQKSLAGSERALKRTEDKIAEEKRTKELEVQLRSGEWVTTDSNIFAHSKLTDNQKIQLVEINRKVKQRQEVGATPESRAAASALALKTKRNLTRAAVSGDFTGFGFPEGVVPSAEQLEQKIVDLYLDKLLPKDFEDVLQSAKKSLSIDEFIDNDDAKKPLGIAYKRILEQYKNKRIEKRLQEYSEKFLNGTPVLSYLEGELKREVYESVEDHLAQGHDLTPKTLSNFYEEASLKVIQPIQDFAKLKATEAKDFLSNPNNFKPQEVEPSSLRKANQAGLDNWNRASALNGGYPDEEYLKAWDAWGLERPSAAPAGGTDPVTAPQTATEPVPTTTPQTPTEPVATTEQPEVLEQEIEPVATNWSPENTLTRLEGIPEKTVKDVAGILKADTGKAHPHRDDVVAAGLEALSSHFTGPGQLGGVDPAEILAGMSEIGVDVTDKAFLTEVNKALEERKEAQELTAQVFDSMFATNDFNLLSSFAKSKAINSYETLGKIKDSLTYLFSAERVQDIKDQATKDKMLRQKEILANIESLQKKTKPKTK